MRGKSMCSILRIAAYIFRPQVGLHSNNVGALFGSELIRRNRLECVNILQRIKWRAPPQAHLEHRSGDNSNKVAAPVTTPHHRRLWQR